MVVGTDGSDTATEAVRQAASLAARLDAKVHLVSAYESVPERRLRDEHNRPRPDLEWMMHPREGAATTLAEARRLFEGQGVEVELHAREGDPADAILDVAEETDADVIIVGNKGMTGAKRFLLGSVPNKISHHAPCSVMIIRTS
jgi:nucleotide-binding universal stress UspA family protein